MLIADYQIFSDFSSPIVKMIFFLDFLTFVNNQTRFTYCQTIHFTVY